MTRKSCFALVLFATLCGATPVWAQRNDYGSFDMARMAQNQRQIEAQRQATERWQFWSKFLYPGVFAVLVTIAQIFGNRERKK